MHVEGEYEGETGACCCVRGRLDYSLLWLNPWYLMALPFSSFYLCIFH